MIHKKKRSDTAVKNADQKRDPIALGLKRVYDETLQEPLPDELVELLDRLRKSADG